jgi:hypothetical protein
MISHHQSIGTDCSQPEQLRCGLISKPVYRSTGQRMVSRRGPTFSRTHRRWR